MIRLLVLFALSITMMLYACSDEPTEPEKGICQSENYVDGDYPNCDCSEETHFIYEYADGRTDCFRKLNLAFKATFSDSICFEGIDDNMLDGINALFIFRIKNSDKYIIQIIEDETPGYSYIPSNFGDIEIDTLSDGRYRFTAVDYGRKYQCYDYGDQSDCDNSIFGYLQGETNTDNTEMQIKVQYRDCSQQILGTGYINCYKDW